MTATASGRWFAGGLVALFAIGSACEKTSSTTAESDRSSASPVALGARTLVIAHRGDASETPENTLPAIERAFAVGADAVEIDIHLTADGVPVVIHDDVLETTTTGRGPVAKHTLAQLQLLDAGSWKSPAYAGTRIPTLRAALEVIRGRGLVLLDPKQDGMGRAIAAALHEAEFSPREVILGSWNEAQAADFVLHLPDAFVLQSTNEGSPDRWGPEDFSRLRARGLRGFELGNRWSPAFVAAARAEGMPVYAYTVNDAAAMRSLVSMGISGIETDSVTTLLQVVKEAEAGRRVTPD